MSMYDLTLKDKEEVKHWIKKMREFNNPKWEKDKNARKGYEKALRHLNYAITTPREII